MFQGQNYSLREIDRGRYEFKTAYTQRVGSITDIHREVQEHVSELQRNGIELALIRQKLREAGENEVRYRAAMPEPTVVKVAPAVLAPMSLVPKPSTKKPSARSAAPEKTASKTHVHVSESARPKRRKSGLSYLSALLADAQTEKLSMSA